MLFLLFDNCLVHISGAAIHRRLKEQIKGIDAVKVRDVELFWYGMAEVRNLFIFIHVIVIFRARQNPDQTGPSPNSASLGLI